MTTTAENSYVNAELQPAWPDTWGEDEHGPYLVATLCVSCKGLALGKRMICPHCLESDSTRIDRERIGRNGTLYTATVISQSAPEFETPFRVGYVDVEGGVRIFAHIEQGEQAPMIGDQVRLAIEPVKSDSDGNRLAGPFYQHIVTG